MHVSSSQKPGHGAGWRRADWHLPPSPPVYYLLPRTTASWMSAAHRYRRRHLHRRRSNFPPLIVYLQAVVLCEPSCGRLYVLDAVGSVVVGDMAAAVAAAVAGGVFPLLILKPLADPVATI